MEVHPNLVMQVSFSNSPELIHLYEFADVVAYMNPIFTDIKVSNIETCIIIFPFM